MADKQRPASRDGEMLRRIRRMEPRRSVGSSRIGFGKMPRRSCAGEGRGMEQPRSFSGQVTYLTTTRARRPILSASPKIASGR